MHMKLSFNTKHLDDNFTYDDPLPPNWLVLQPSCRQSAEVSLSPSRSHYRTQRHTEHLVMIFYNYLKISPTKLMQQIIT